MGQKIVKLGLVCRILLGGVVMFFKIEDQRHQGFGDEPAAEQTKMAPLVGTGAKRIECDGHRVIPFWLNA